MIRKFSMATALLMAASASAYAADLPRRTPPPVFVPPPLFTWTGLYVGGDIGYAWGTDSTTSGSLPFGFFDGTNATPQGEIGGAHIGYNYQINQFVLGIEGDVDGLSFRNTATSLLSGTIYTTNVPIEGSVRGRIGYAWDRLLFFATGGVAFAELSHSYVGGIAALASPLGYYSYSNGRTGWTVGGGVEYALSNNWSVRGEYRYAKFGNSSDTLSPLAAGAPVFYSTHSLTENRVTVGFSYKFDLYAPPAPVVAKY